MDQIHGKARQQYYKAMKDAGYSDHEIFAIRNAAKDLRYFSQMSLELKMASPVSPSVLATFSLAEAMGKGEEFVPKLCDVIAGLNNVDVHKG